MNKNSNTAWCSRAISAALLIVVGATCLPASLAAQEETVIERIEHSRDLLNQRDETHRKIAEVRQQWTWNRQLLQDRIEVVTDEVARFKKASEEAQASIEGFEKEKKELEAEQEKLVEVGKAFEERLLVLEARTRSLLTKLPKEVLTRVDQYAQQIPAEGKETELSIAIRYGNVIALLNAVNRFNREITLTSDLRKIGEGATARVDVLYLGLGQAYYVTADATAAGIGTMSPDGWVWLPANDSAKDIAKAIKIYRCEENAEFVPLPIRIK